MAKHENDCFAVTPATTSCALLHNSGGVVPGYLNCDFAPHHRRGENRGSALLGRKVVEKAISILKLLWFSGVSTQTLNRVISGEGVLLSGEQLYCPKAVNQIQEGI